MNVYCCGFNGFLQIVDDCSCIACFSLICLNVKNVRDIDLTWSCLVVLCESEIFLSGYSGGGFKHLKSIIKPAPDIEFSRVRCGEKYALFTTLEGTCWQYTYSDEEWRKLPDFAIVEEEILNENCENKTEKIEDEVKSSCASSSPASKQLILNFKNGIKKICCGSIVNISLDKLGQVYSMPSRIPMPGIKIVDVACGFEHSVMLDDMGRVYTLGYGMRGQLGNDVLEIIENPQEVNALGGLNVVKIAAGGWHSAAITECGVLYTWGWNNAGQLGFPTMISDEMSYSTELTFETDQTMVVESSCRRNKNHLKSKKAGGEEKSSSTKASNSDKALEKCDSFSFSETNLTDKCSTDSHLTAEEAMAETSDSEISEDSSGSDDLITVLAVPKAVDFPEDVNAVDVSCGNRHTVVLADDGCLWACGWNAYGQLGKSPYTLAFSDSMIKMDVALGSIKGIHCGGWNTAVFVD